MHQSEQHGILLCSCPASSFHKRPFVDSLKHQGLGDPVPVVWVRIDLREYKKVFCLACSSDVWISGEINYECRLSHHVD